METENMRGSVFQPGLIFITSGRKDDWKPCLPTSNLAPSGSRTRFGQRRKRNSIYLDHGSMEVRPGQRKTRETNGLHTQIIFGEVAKGPQNPTLNLNRLFLKACPTSEA